MVENASADRTTNLAIFKFFLQQFRATMDDKTSGHVEQAMAIKGYGCFAAVSLRDMGRVWWWGEGGDMGGGGGGREGGREGGDMGERVWGRGYGGEGGREGGSEGEGGGGRGEGE